MIALRTLPSMRAQGAVQSSVGCSEIQDREYEPNPTWVGSL